MAILEKNSTGLYTIKPGDTLSKIASNSGRTLSDLLSSNPAFQANPNVISPGQTVNLGNNLTPTYSNLATSNLGGSSGGYNAPSQPEDLSSLISRMIKDSQTNTGSQYSGNLASLLKGKENINTTNAGVYSGDLVNPNLSVSDRLSILNSSGNNQSGGLKSITDQMTLNEARFKTGNELIDKTLDIYKDEANRRLDEKKMKQDQSNWEKEFAENKRQFNTEQSNKGIGTGTGIPGISKQAQDIIDIMNVQGGSVDDYVKGTSNAAQKLRSEVFAGLAAAGGNTQKNKDLLTEAKAVIDDMIAKEDWKEFGYSSRFGGQYLTSYGDMKMRADQISAILARDNLGLLKGAMSDKDLAFIQAMSGGIDGGGTISESYARERMNSIQEKIANKINKSYPQSKPGDRIVNYQGRNYSVDANGEMTPI